MLKTKQGFLASCRGEPASQELLGTALAQSCKALPLKSRREASDVPASSIGASSFGSWPRFLSAGTIVPVTHDLPLRCSCGSLRGVARALSASRGNRVVCYCDDCQSFAYFLERADELLDVNGGTDIFQTSPAHLEITRGKEHLACVRLAPRGMLRWHTSCCRTPIANTLASGAVPFVGLITRCLDPEAVGQSLDGVLGPVRVRVFGRYAKGDRSEFDAHDKSAPSVGFRLGRIILGARLRGDRKRSPFFDSATLERVATPRVLAAEELAAVEAARDAA